jgi:hypothetical protein
LHRSHACGGEPAFGVAAGAAIAPAIPNALSETASRVLEKFAFMIISSQLNLVFRQAQSPYGVNACLER